MSAETPARLTDGLTTGSLLRRYAVLCGYLIGLFGWVVALPLYGSVGRAWAEARGVGFASLPLGGLAHLGEYGENTPAEYLQENPFGQPPRSVPAAGGGGPGLIGRSGCLVRKPP